MQRRLIVAILALMLILLVGVQAQAGSWWWPGGGDSIDELANTSTYVVRVEALGGMRVRVLEVFQGEIQPGDTIRINHLGGGVISRFLLNLTGEVPSFSLTRGNDLVLFLAIWGERPYTTLLNPWQGAYRFPDSNESTLTLDAHTALEDIRPGRDLRLTIGDLQQLAETNFGDDSREVLAHRGLWPIHPVVGLLLILATATAVIVVRRRITKRRGDKRQKEIA